MKITDNVMDANEDFYRTFPLNGFRSRKSFLEAHIPDPTYFLS